MGNLFLDRGVEERGHTNPEGVADAIVDAVRRPNFLSLVMVSDSVSDEHGTKRLQASQHTLAEPVQDCSHQLCSWNRVVSTVYAPSVRLHPCLCWPSPPMLIALARAHVACLSSKVDTALSCTLTVQLVRSTLVAQLVRSVLVMHLVMEP